jgi:hypothetical protein
MVATSWPFPAKIASIVISDSGYSITALIVSCTATKGKRCCDQAKDKHDGFEA